MTKKEVTTEANDRRPSPIKVQRGKVISIWQPISDIRYPINERISQPISRPCTDMPHSFPLLQRIAQRAQTAPTAHAIIDTVTNRTIDYATLYADTCAYARELESRNGTQQDLRDARVGILAEKGYPLIVALLATFSAGGLAIPLLPSLPQPEHAYMLSNGTASVLLHDNKNKERAKALQAELVREGLTLSLVPDFTHARATGAGGEDVDAMQELAGERKAMMLFTSGTVSRCSLPTVQAVYTTILPPYTDRSSKGRRHAAFRPFGPSLKHRRSLALERERKCPPPSPLPSVPRSCI